MHGIAPYPLNKTDEPFGGGAGARLNKFSRGMSKLNWENING